MRQVGQAGKQAGEPQTQGITMSCLSGAPQPGLALDPWLAVGQWSWGGYDGEGMGLASV